MTDSDDAEAVVAEWFDMFPSLLLRKGQGDALVSRISLALRNAAARERERCADAVRAIDANRPGDSSDAAIGADIGLCLAEKAIRSLGDPDVE